MHRVHHTACMVAANGENPFMFMNQQWPERGVCGLNRFHRFLIGKTAYLLLLHTAWEQTGRAALQ